MTAANPILCAIDTAELARAQALVAGVRDVVGGIAHQDDGRYEINAVPPREATVGLSLALSIRRYRLSAMHKGDGPWRR